MVSSEATLQWAGPAEVCSENPRQYDGIGSCIDPNPYSVVYKENMINNSSMFSILCLLHFKSAFVSLFGAAGYTVTEVYLPHNGINYTLISRTEQL